jgi:hypothetical protein
MYYGVFEISALMIVFGHKNGSWENYILFSKCVVDNMKNEMRGICSIY